MAKLVLQYKGKGDYNMMVQNDQGDPVHMEVVQGLILLDVKDDVSSIGLQENRVTLEFSVPYKDVVWLPDATH